MHRFTRRIPRVLRSLFTAAGALAGAGARSPPRPRPMPVADFYKGKTVNLLIGVGVGGEYDLHARLSGRYIGKHIPGNPTVVPQNMTGAGGLKMANYLYTVAPKDGTSLGMMANNFPMMQAVGANGVQFDATQMAWIGSIAPTVETMGVWHTAGVNSVEDARNKEVVAGASGRGAITFTFPTAMNEFLGTKFKIVTGYEGGNAINLAIERGEVQARNNTWSSWKVTKADWLRDKKIVIIAQAGPKAKDLPGVPSLTELARNDGRPQDSRADRLGHRVRPPARHHVRRAGGARQGFARRLHGDHEGRRIPRRGQQAQHRGRSGERRAYAAAGRPADGHAEKSRGARQSDRRVTARRGLR